jgi:hypothetical protein
LSYRGGAHKAISGSFSFFSQSVENSMGSLNFNKNMTKINNVFVVLSGNITPIQRKIIKKRCTTNVSHFKEKYEWLRRNNPYYTSFSEFNECPCPVVLEDDNSMDEESENPTIKQQMEIQYWFPSNGDQDLSNSVFNSQSEFIGSLLKNKEPTLIFTSKKYQPDYKLTLPVIFPLCHVRLFVLCCSKSKIYKIHVITHYTCHVIIY